MMVTSDDLFVVDCLKEIPWPYGQQPDTEFLVQDSAGRLMRVVRDTPDAPFASTHEWVAEQLGRLLGLAVPSGARVRFSHHDAFAHPVEPGWLPFAAEDLENTAGGAALAGDILAFDLWLGNRARHAGALVIEPPAAPDAAENTGAAAPERSRPTPRLVLLRHQFCFMGLYDEDDEGGAFDPIPPEPAQIAGGHPLCRFITSQYDFDGILQRLERLDASVVRDILRGLPQGWLSPSQKALVHDYLMRRAGTLRAQLNALRPHCPLWD